MELKRKRSEDGSDIVIKELPEKKRGRHFLLGELDEMVQMYLKKVREQGGVITGRIVVAAAQGILISCDRSKLVEYGGHVRLTTSWAYSLLNRMGYVLRKASIAKSKYNMENFEALKEAFLNDVRAIVELEEIPCELVLNWDQTGIKIIPTSQ